MLVADVFQFLALTNERQGLEEAHAAAFFQIPHLGWDQPNQPMQLYRYMHLQYNVLHIGKMIQVDALEQPP